MCGPSCVDGAGKVNWKGVAYYNRLIDYLLERGNYPNNMKSSIFFLLILVFSTLVNIGSFKFSNLEIFFGITGITPYANLYHYDLPEALEKKYKGLLSPEVV